MYLYLLVYVYIETLYFQIKQIEQIVNENFIYTVCIQYGVSF